MTFHGTSPNTILTALTGGDVQLPLQMLEQLQIGQLVFQLSGALIHINPQARHLLHLENLDPAEVTLQELCQECNNLHPQRIMDLLAHHTHSVEWVQGMQVHYFTVAAVDGQRLGMVALVPGLAQEGTSFSASGSTADALFEISPDCLKHLDARGHLLKMNQNGQRLMEVEDLSSVQHADWITFWPEESRPRAQAALQDARMGRVGRFQGTCPTLKGTLKHWDVVILPLMEGLEVKGMVVSSRDITSQMRQQEQEQAFLASQQRFVSDAAHELRTPVAAILGNLDVIFRYPDIPQDEKEDILRDVHLSATRLSRVVNDMLQLARGNAGIRQDEEVPLHDVVLSAWKEARSLSSTHRFDLGRVDTIELYGETDRLKQLAVILLDNAIKYTPAGGHIHMHLQQQDSHAVFTVQDSGIGIAKEHQQQVFERFFRVDRTRVDSRDPGGTGLGLPIARWIVDGHGGHIALHSEPGKGTTFQVTLPIESQAGDLA